MIRVDNMEDYKKLRDSGFNGDIIVLFKGGEVNVTETGNEETGNEETGNEETGNEEAGNETGNEAGNKEAGNDEAGTGVQFSYEKVVNEVYRKILPVIQAGNRSAVAGRTDEEENLNDIMKKLIN